MSSPRKRPRCDNETALTVLGHEECLSKLDRYKKKLAKALEDCHKAAKLGQDLLAKNAQLEAQIKAIQEEQKAVAPLDSNLALPTPELDDLRLQLERFKNLTEESRHELAKAEAKIREYELQSAIDAQNFASKERALKREITSREEIIASKTADVANCKTLIESLEADKRNLASKLEAESKQKQHEGTSINYFQDQIAQLTEMSHTLLYQRDQALESAKTKSSDLELLKERMSMLEEQSAQLPGLLASQDELQAQADSLNILLEEERAKSSQLQTKLDQALGILPVDSNREDATSHPATTILSEVDNQRREIAQQHAELEREHLMSQELHAHEQNRMRRHLRRMAQSGTGDSGIDSMYVAKIQRALASAQEEIRALKQQLFDLESVPVEPILPSFEGNIHDDGIIRVLKAQIESSNAQIARLRSSLHDEVMKRTSETRKVHDIENQLHLRDTEIAQLKSTLAQYQCGIKNVPSEPAHPVTSHSNEDSNNECAENSLIELEFHQSETPVKSFSSPHRNQKGLGHTKNGSPHPLRVRKLQARAACPPTTVDDNPDSKCPTTQKQFTQHPNILPDSADNEHVSVKVDSSRSSSPAPAVPPIIRKIIVSNSTTSNDRPPQCSQQ